MNSMSKSFKLSVIAATLFTAINAQAAIYKVVEVQPITIDAKETHGVAIQPSLPGENCFVDTDCADGDSYAIAVEGRNWDEGISYREEVPFGTDNSFRVLDDNGDKDDFEYYCDRELRYSICESWAETKTEGYQKEVGGDYTNAPAEVVGGSYDGIVNQDNTVINRLTANGEAIGNSRDGDDIRNQAFVDQQDLFTPTDSPKVVESRAFASDATGDYTVGSISRFERNSNGEHYSSKATIWNQSKAIEIPWGSGVNVKKDQLIAQGSLRDLMVDEDENKLYGVGYNTYDKDHNHMDATIFTCDSGLTCTSKQVLGTTDRDRYSNSVVERVNTNGVAVGEAKLRASDSGSQANLLFYVKDVKNPTATYLNNSGQAIFFKGAGGQVGGLNDRNELVGQIDAQQHQTTHGKPRMQRGFIYPLPVEASENMDFAPNDTLGNKARLLDDLTNDGTGTTNNEFRITNATDINNAGVISATALKCEGGYQSAAHNARCDGTEQIVAVKLVPISGVTSADIQARNWIEPTISRSGGSLGLFALTLLGWLGFRRARA